MNNKTYYKVVSSNLESAISVFRRAEWIVEYKVGEWVKPNVEDSKLMVFDNLNDAIKFATPSKLKVFECEVINPNNPRVIFHWMSDYSLYWKLFVQMNKDFVLFEKELSINPSYNSKNIICPVVPGTIFCDEVKLVKEVSYEKSKF